MLTVSHPIPLASWYQFYCLVNRDTRALVACPELLVRKFVESGIGPGPSDPRAETLITQPTAHYACYTKYGPPAHHAGYSYGTYVQHGVQQKSTKAAQIARP